MSIKGYYFFAGQHIKTYLETMEELHTTIFQVFLNLEFDTLQTDNTQYTG